MKCTRNFLWWILFLSGFGTFFAILWLSFQVVFGDEESLIPDKKDTLFDIILFYVSLPVILFLMAFRTIFFDKGSGSPSSFKQDGVEGYDLGEDDLGADDEYYIYNEFIDK